MEKLYDFDKKLETNLTVSTRQDDIDFINKICGNSHIEVIGNLFLIDYLNKQNKECKILESFSNQVINLNNAIKISQNSNKIFIILRSNPDFINDGFLTSDVDLILLYKGKAIFIEYISYQYHLADCLFKRAGFNPLEDKNLIKAEKAVFEKDNNKSNKIQLKGYKCFHINGSETHRPDILELRFRKFIECLVNKENRNMNNV